MKTLELTIENAAPFYWKHEGGAQYIITTPCGAVVQALRPCSISRWEFYGPDAEQTVGPSSWTDTDAIIHAKSILRSSLIESLALFPSDGELS